MYKQYDFTLPGGFRLPVALCVDTYQSFGVADGESETFPLGEFARQYLKAHMTAGQILSGTQTILRTDGALCLKGTYVCTEAIGKVKPEQIGEANVKTNGENRECRSRG